MIHKRVSSECAQGRRYARSFVVRLIAHVHRAEGNLEYKVVPVNCSCMQSKIFFIKSPLSRVYKLPRYIRIAVILEQFGKRHMYYIQLFDQLTVIPKPTICIKIIFRTLKKDVVVTQNLKKSVYMCVHTKLFIYRFELYKIP